MVTSLRLLGMANAQANGKSMTPQPADQELQLREDIVEERKGKRTENPMAYLVALRALGWTFIERNRFDEAVSTYKEFVDFATSPDRTWKQMSWQEIDLVLGTSFNFEFESVASAFTKQHRLEDATSARDLCRKVLELRVTIAQNAQSPNSDRITATLFDLARYDHIYAKNNEQAEDLYHQIIKLNAAGQTNPLLRLALDDLAQILFERSEWSELREISQQWIQLERPLKADEPFSLASALYLGAFASFKLGDPLALSLSEEAVDIL